MDLKITTIRKNVTQKQVEECKLAYLGNPDICDRFNPYSFDRCGKSQVEIEEDGFKIVTIVEVVGKAQSSEIGSSDRDILTRAGILR